MISGHIARSSPEDRRVRIDVVHAAVLIACRVDADLRRIHRAYLRRGLACEAQRGAFAILRRAVCGYRRHGDLVGYAFLHLVKRQRVARLLRVLKVHKVCLAVRDAHVVPGHIARSSPEQRRVGVDVVHAAILVACRVDADLRRIHCAYRRLRRGFGGSVRRRFGRGRGGGVRRRFSRSCGGGVRRRFSRSCGGGIRRGCGGGRGRLRRLQGEAHIRGLAIFHRAVHRHRGDAQGVNLAFTHVARAQRGGGGGEFLRGQHLAHAVKHLHQIVVHVAVGAPAQRQRALRHIVNHIHADARNRVDRHRGNANLARRGGRGNGGRGRRGRDRGRGRGGRAGEGELQVRPAGIVHGAVFGNRTHGNGVEHAFLQRADGQISGGIGYLLGNDGIAGAVGHAHIVGGHIAVGRPGEGDAANRRINVVHAARNRIDGRNANFRRANLAGRGRRSDGGHRRRGGFDIDGRILGEQQLLRLHRGYAGHIQPGGALEQLDGSLRHGAEIAGDVGIVVVQVAQAALQGGHTVVGIATLQGDIAAVLRRVGGKQPALQGGGGHAGLTQAQFGLQAADGRYGGVVVGAAGRALIVVQLLEALVQFAHAIAGIAALHVDIALAGGSVGGIEPLQRFAGGAAVAGQAVFLLEQGHGLLGALAVDAVRAVSQIAQRAQAILHDGHAQAGIAARKGLVGVVIGQILVKEHILKLCRGHAVDREATVGQIGLQQAHGILRFRAEDAIRIVVEVAQLDQALLQGAHGLAAAAARKRAIFLLRLKHIHGGFLIGNLPGGDQRNAVLRVGGVRGILAEVKGGHFRTRPPAGAIFGLQILGRKYAVEVDLAAHGLQAQSGKRIAVGSQALEVAAVVKLQRAFLDMGAVNFARGFIEQKQGFGAGGDLRKLAFQRGHHAPGHLRRVKRLEAALAGGGGDVVDVAIEDGKVLHAEVHKLHTAIFERLDAQKALVAQAQEIFIRIGGAGGQLAGVFGKDVGALRKQKRALSRRQFGDDSLRQRIKGDDIAAGRRRLRAAVRSGVVAHELRAVQGRYVIHRFARKCAGPVHAIGNGGFAEV